LQPQISRYRRNQIPGAFAHMRSQGDLRLAVCFSSVDSISPNKKPGTGFPPGRVLSTSRATRLLLRA
jgi:hypothetical protein